MSSSTTTTQKTEIPDPSPQEKALMEMMTGALMPAYLNEQGYDVKQTTGRYEDSNEYRNFTDRRSRLSEEKASYEKQIADLQAGTNRFGDNNSTMEKINQLNQKVSSINKSLDSLDKEEQNFLSDYEPETSFSVRKMMSPEVEAQRQKMVEKYGDLTDEQFMAMTNEDGNYYKGLVDMYNEDLVEQDKAQRELADLYMEKTKKFLEGDFSITDEQKQLIEDNMAPIRESMTKMFDDALAEADITKTSLLEQTKKTFDEFDAQVKETGMNLVQGLEAVGAQVKQTGADMETALSNTIGVHKELMKMGIEDYTGEVTKQVAMSAAQIGRSPDDPEYTKEMQDLVARKVQEGSLNLAAMEAQGMLAIKERTGSGLEDVERQKVGVAERTGGMLEQSTLQRGQQEGAILERYGQTREELARARGAADVGLEETAANLRWNVGAGMPPQQIAIAQGVQEYNQAQAQQRIANAQSAMYAPMPFVQYFQQDRMAQPTSTTVQKSNPGIGGIFSGIMGAAAAGAGIYSGVASAGAMRSMASAYQNNPYGGGAWHPPMVY